MSLLPAGHDGHSTPSPVLLAKDRTLADFSIGGFWQPSWGVGLSGPRGVLLPAFAVSLSPWRRTGHSPNFLAAVSRTRRALCKCVRSGPGRARLENPAPHLRWRNFPGTGAILFCVDFSTEIFRDRQGTGFRSRWAREPVLSILAASHLVRIL